MPRPEHIKQHTKIEETELRKWAYSNGYNISTFAIKIGAREPTVFDWFYGSSIPSLLMAIRIEEITAGAVPCTYWVGTILGKYLYEELKNKLLNKEESLAKIKNRKRADGLDGGKAALLLNKSQQEYKNIREAQEIKKANEMLNNNTSLNEEGDFVE